MALLLILPSLILLCWYYFHPTCNLCLLVIFLVSSCAVILFSHVLKWTALLFSSHKPQHYYQSSVLSLPLLKFCFRVVLLYSCRSLLILLFSPVKCLYGSISPLDLKIMNSVWNKQYFHHNGDDNLQMWNMFKLRFTCIYLYV